MFKKPYKIKSNTQVKGSERKTFKELLLSTYKTLTEDQVNDFVHKKEVLNSVKIVTHDEEVVLVYTIQKRPMLFDVRGKIYPTVYLLWKFPNLVYTFTTHTQVMSNISGGADLMLPGVVTPAPQTGLSKYGSLSENNICCVNLTSNKAAIAVGVASQSSASMALANGRGRCVTICHFYGDKLCSLEGMGNLPVPNMGPPDWLKLKSYNDDFPELGAKKSAASLPESSSVDDSSSSVQEDAGSSETAEEDAKESVEEQDEEPEDMDELLMYCFLGAIKYSKSLNLPILTSNFFKLQLLPVCPAGKTLDIKRTTYKKLKPFLEKMCELELITVKEIKKGVEAITAVNKNHPLFAEFYINPESRPKKETSDLESAQSTNVTESYLITQLVLPIFKPEGFQKNDTVQGSDIRKYVTKYVKDNNCQDETNSKLVKPNDTLRAISKTDSSITWEELIEKVIASMKNCYKVTAGADEFVNKGKVSPITLSVSVRSGNKKVTLVDNLELFGVRISEFAKECQHGVAASTSVSRPPGKKSDQLLVQGNQILFVYNLLTDKYKIPKKYIKGLENAPKKKK